MNVDTAKNDLPQLTTPFTGNTTQKLFLVRFSTAMLRQRHNAALGLLKSPFAALGIGAI